MLTNLINNSFYNPNILPLMPKYTIETYSLPTDYIKIHSDNQFMQYDDIGNIDVTINDYTKNILDPVELSPVITDSTIETDSTICDNCKKYKIMKAMCSTLCTKCYYMKYGGIPITDHADVKVGQSVTVYNFKRGNVHNTAYVRLVCSMSYGNIYYVKYIKINKSVRCDPRRIAYIYINNDDNYYCVYASKPIKNYIERCTKYPNDTVVRDELNNKCIAFMNNNKINCGHNRVYKIVKYSLPYEL